MDTDKFLKLNSTYVSNIKDEEYILSRITKDYVEIHYKKDYPFGFVRIISKDGFVNFFTLKQDGYKTTKKRTRFKQ